MNTREPLAAHSPTSCNFYGKKDFCARSKIVRNKSCAQNGLLYLKNWTVISLRSTRWYSEVVDRKTACRKENWYIVAPEYALCKSSKIYKFLWVLLVQYIHMCFWKNLLKTRGAKKIHKRQIWCYFLTLNKEIILAVLFMLKQNFL